MSCGIYRIDENDINCEHLIFLMYMALEDMKHKEALEIMTNNIKEISNEKLCVYFRILTSYRNNMTDFKKVCLKLFKDDIIPQMKVITFIWFIVMTINHNTSMEAIFENQDKIQEGQYLYYCNSLRTLHTFDESVKNLTEITSSFNISDY